MLRPVELDAAGDPWTGKAYQRRLDHVIIIYEVIIVGFVKGTLDTATKFREDHDKQIIIFQVNRLVLYVFFLVGYFFRYRKGINLSGTSLICPVFYEQWTFFRGIYFISRKGYGFFPYMDFLV